MQQGRNKHATGAGADPPKVAAAEPRNGRAVPEQEAELRKLVSIVAADWPDRDEALAVALADPVNALTCFRALARDQLRADQAQSGPYTDAPLSERDPDDDRRTCTDCANLTPREGRCLAAWRGEGPPTAARDYHPIKNALLRCIAYAPKPSDPDQRPGRERWPITVEDANRLRELARRG
jgi:hypothetical protein